MTLDSEDAKKMFREWLALFGMEGPVQIGMVSQPVSRLASAAEYVSALEADLDAVTTYAAVLEAALEQICTDAKRVDVYSNGALLDLVQPFLIDRARAALKGDANG